MPRVSIVVPFAGDERALHLTLLAVLENRPEDSEVIVAHDGSYHDPYRLLGDEVIDIEVLDAGSTVRLVNEAVLAACAPIVQTLIPGTVVSAGWVEEPLEILAEDPLVSGVILPATDLDSGRKLFGFDMAALPRRIELNKSRYRGAATPPINGTFLRRRTLRLLDGLMELPSVENAEIELGLAMRTLGLEAVIAEESSIQTQFREGDAAQGAYGRGQAYGRVALAYSKIDSSGVEISSVLSRLGHLAGGLMKPTSVAERLGWVFGLTDTKLVASIRERISAAAEILEQQAAEDDALQSLPMETHAPAAFRRAA